MAKPEFQQWFVQQFGERPSLVRDAKKLQDKIEDGEHAECLLRQSQEWDRTREAAWKAWIAKRP